MDLQHQTSLQNDLLEAWNAGAGDETQSELRAKILSHRIRNDEGVAKFHLGTITIVANGSMKVPTANMILHDCYLRGWAVEADPVEALRHLRLAIAGGSEIAEWFFASYLIDNKLAHALPRDPDRAMGILRKLAREAKDISAMSLARRSFARHVATTLNFNDVSSKDRELIDWHVGNIQEVIGMDHLHLALFYAGGQSDTDYRGNGYRQSRDLLVAGSLSNSEKVRDACNAQLDLWGVRPVPAPLPTPTEKAVETVKVAGMLGGAAAILIFWSVVGLTLLSIVAAINAIMIPVVLVLVVVGCLIFWLRR